MFENRPGMEQLVVEDVAEREPGWIGGGYTASLESFADFTPEMAKLWYEAGGKKEYTFQKHKAYMRLGALAIQLINEGKVAEAVETVEYGVVLPLDERDLSERWAFWTVQMPGDWGPQFQHDRIDMRKTLTDKSSGVVIEAMCGFTSYIDDSEDIQEVIAMDFCREGLERYDHPDRERIIFDLNTINGESKIDFIEDGSVDTICITFGVDYLENPQAVYNEFYRILSENGKLLIIGGKYCGYQDLLKQYFNPNFHKPMLEKAGFKVDVIPLDYDHHETEPTYHLIESTKVSQ